MMKIALITRSTIFSIRGGDTVQVEQTAKHLLAIGVHAEIKKTDENISYEEYDLLHFFNIIRPADILFHVERSGLPYVVSTIFVDYSEFEKQHRAGIKGLIFRFLSPDGIEYLKTIARKLLGRDKLMSQSYLWRGQYHSVRKVIKYAVMLLPNSLSEYKRLSERYHCKAPYTVVPNGIDPAVFQENDSVEKDPLLILCVARVEGIKNQLNLIKALNDTKFRLVLIGSYAPNQYAYYRNCKKIASKNVRFIDHIPQEQLIQYYQKAKVHILPSWFETTGLSSLEAAAMGCSIVITDKGDTKEYFNDDVIYCDPSSCLSIYNAVEKASTIKNNNAVKEKIHHTYNWSAAALRTKMAYDKILTV